MRGGVLAARHRQIQPQPMFAILAAAQALQARGQRVIHLEIGDTSGFCNTALIARVRDDIGAETVGYGPSAGEPALRAAFAALYARELGCAIGAAHVVVAPANALISQVLALLCDPGDAVLVPDPGFPTYRLAAAFNGVAVAGYRLRGEAGWSPDLDQIASLLVRTKRVRAILVNSPSNPLGVAMSQAELDAITALAERHGIACVFDDCYVHLGYDGAPARPRPGARHVHIYTMSKDAAVPGLRLGCCVGDPELVAGIADYNSLFFSCQPRFIQLAAAAYLRDGGDFPATIRAAMPARIAAVADILAGCPRLGFVTPSAAFYVFVDVSAVMPDDVAFALRLLHERGVAVCPGSHFGPAGRGHVRISLGGVADDILAGCRILVDAVALITSEAGVPRAGNIRPAVVAGVAAAVVS